MLALIKNQKMDFKKQIVAITDELAKNEVPFDCSLQQRDANVNTGYITMSEINAFEEAFNAIAIDFHKIDLLSISEEIVNVCKQGNSFISVLANIFDGALDAFVHSQYIHLYLSEKAIAAFKQVRSTLVKTFGKLTYQQVILLNCPKIPAHLLSKAQRDKELDEAIALGNSPQAINWDFNGVENPHSHSSEANSELYSFLKRIMKLKVAFGGKITIETNFHKAFIYFVAPNGEMKKHLIDPGTKKEKQLFAAILRQEDTSDYSRVRFNIVPFYLKNTSVIINNKVDLNDLKRVFENWISEKHEVDYYCTQLQIIENPNL